MAELKPSIAIRELSKASRFSGYSGCQPSCGRLVRAVVSYRFPHVPTIVLLMHKKWSCVRNIQNAWTGSYAFTRGYAYHFQQKDLLIFISQNIRSTENRMYHLYSDISLQAHYAHDHLQICTKGSETWIVWFPSICRRSLKQLWKLLEEFVWFVLL